MSNSWPQQQPKQSRKRQTAATKDRYLLTGAQGFIGRYLVKHLLSTSEDAIVLGIGRSPRQDIHFLHSLSCAGRQLHAPLPHTLQATDLSRYSYAALNLSSNESTDEIVELIRGFAPTVVIHLAASLRGVDLNDETIFQNNVSGTAALLDAIGASGTRLRMFLLASSGGVYGSQNKQPIREDAEAAPLDPYAQSKVACENRAREFALISATPTAVARIFNVLGPGQDELHFSGRIVSQIGSITGHNSPTAIRAGSLASSRDFLDVRDVGSALCAILERNRQGIVNVGGGSETKLRDLLGLFVASASLTDKITVETEATRADSIPRHVADISLLRSLGFLPRHPLPASCRDMLAYQRRFVHSQCQR